MDVTTDRACDEIRREEPVSTLEGPAPHAIPTSLLAKKTDNLSPTEATRSPPLAWVGFQDALPDRPLADIARVTHNELLLPDTAGLPAPWTHELSVHTENQFPDIQASESSLGSPHSVPRFFFNPGSLASSNSSDGSSLFGSPRALSTGARSTSSDFYGCDSTSSSREVSPFGSPSGGSFPLFRFAFPKDARQALSVLDPPLGR